MEEISDAVTETGNVTKASSAIRNVKMKSAILVGGSDAASATLADNGTTLIILKTIANTPVQIFLERGILNPSVTITGTSPNFYLTYE